MTLERPLEEVIPEPAFAELLSPQLGPFGGLCNALRARPLDTWSKRHFHQLATEADALESYLDDYGAKFNRSFVLVREIIASTRWMSLAGFSLTHLASRFDSYGLPTGLGAEESGRFKAFVARAHATIARWICTLVERVESETARAGVAWPHERLTDDRLKPAKTRLRLPRNVGQEEITDESLRIAEVASKYLASCGHFEGLAIRPESDPKLRHDRLRASFKEEQVRFYEASVHNLQSMYDTYIKNTVVEGRDERLARLRGYLSASLHLFETVTVLTHFIERHELESRRGEDTSKVIATLIRREDVEALIHDELLCFATELLQRGRGTAEELLTSYINLQELQVEIPDGLRLHARPAALIVNIVGRYGTPVDMEIAGHRCNAGSILELLVAVGSNPDAKRYTFRGDIHPLRDIATLFENSLGEDGLENLPPALHYLKSGH